MKTLYESILGSNDANLSSELDKKLDEFDGYRAFHQFDASVVSYDYFVKWLDEDKFNRLCIRCLKATRKKTGQYDNEDIMNISLRDGVLLFRFTKDNRISDVSFRPILTNKKVYSYWDAKAAIKAAINPHTLPMSWKAEKQIDAFYYYFEKNKDEVKRHKKDI